MNLWEECNGASHMRAMDIIPWRVVETQERSYVRKLVTNDEELDILEELIEASKPKIDKSLYDHYHYLLFTPFRYPPLKYGSRFGTTFEPSLWYGAMKVETALREIAYYRLLFLHDSDANLKNTIPLTAYSVRAVSQKGIDLTKKPFDKFRTQISSPTWYEYSQPLGKEMRNNSVELFLYYSARTPTLEKNVGIFYPSVFKEGKQLQALQTWMCYAEKNVVEFRHTAQDENEKLVICRLEEFLQDGVLKYPMSANN
jgi:hypothetical protein